MEKIEVWEDYYFDQDVLKKSDQTWNRVWIELAFTLCRKTETLIIFRAHTQIVHFLGGKPFFQIFKFLQFICILKARQKCPSCQVLVLSAIMKCRMSNALLSTACRIWEYQGTMVRLLIFVISAFTLNIKALFIDELIAHNLQLVYSVVTIHNANSICELSALTVTNIPWLSAQQSKDNVLFHILAHVNLDHGDLHIKHELRQCLGVANMLS
jgi:hypothetical protein